MKTKTLSIILFLCLPIIMFANDVNLTATSNSDNSVNIRYNKSAPGSYYIELRFTSLENCRQTRVVQKVVKASNGTLIKLTPSNPDHPINYSYSYRTIKGHPNPKIDENFAYILPFKKGKSIKVENTVNASEKYFDAAKDYYWASFIVDRSEADTVCAMRKGIVVEIEEKYETDNKDMYLYKSTMNEITVEHSDGTIASYSGLAKNSIKVKLGQIVYPQTRLGVLDLFNNNTYRLYFSISYLHSINFEERTIKDVSPYRHLRPMIQTDNGTKTISDRGNYEVECDETTITEEFTRREKKNYKKNKNPFR